MNEKELCPSCNMPLEFVEVDIGVGIIRGNYYCPECNWTPEPAEFVDEDEDDGA